MYKQREAINVCALFNLATKRQDVDAGELYTASWKIFEESKIADLGNVHVIYGKDESGNSLYCKYTELPEEVRQLTALCVCLIGRWFNDLKGARDTMLARFKLSCKPTDFWHDTGIFKNDDIKCNNMQELIEKIAINPPTSKK